MKNRKEWHKNAKTRFNELQDVVTDQMMGSPSPPLQKPYKEESTLIDLPELKDIGAKNKDIKKCLEERRSRRKYTGEPVTLEQLSFLLYYTQGVQRVFQRDANYAVALRTVPSAGARHPFETYLFVNNVRGLEQGVYRYLAVEHKLLLEPEIKCTDDIITEATMGQTFVGEAPVVFIWSAIPYRTEWRYDGEASKLILLDAGHVCQNLYITAEALGLGTCGIAAYDQKKIDEALNFDGEEEFVVYLAPVGNL